MSSHVIDDLTSCILDFQANIVRVTYRKKTTLVEPKAEPMHDSLLQYIWESTKLREDVDPDGQVLKWKKLGFGSENIIEEFQEVGLLGLDCLFNFAQNDTEFFSKVLQMIELLKHFYSYPTPGRFRTTKPTRGTPLPDSQGIKRDCRTTFRILGYLCTSLYIYFSYSITLEI